jgi:acyl-CoA thioesterase-1
MSVYAGLAHAHTVALVPFLMEGIALDEAQFQDDGMHPSAAAQPTMLATVWPRLRPLL